MEKTEVFKTEAGKPVDEKDMRETPQLGNSARLNVIEQKLDEVLLTLNHLFPKNFSL
jgi:hypothetical protein